MESLMMLLKKILNLKEKFNKKRSVLSRLDTPYSFKYIIILTQIDFL